jgi:EmrB/QacA subfamily drug resistance transporter
MNGTSGTLEESSFIKSETGILLATILGSSMAYIDSTAMNVILPVFQLELNAKISQVQWIVEAYALIIASLLLIGGALGDYFGRKIIFKIGVVIFSLSSLWCGLSPNIQILITARCFQGLGGALMVPGSLAIITSTFSTEKRGKAIGTWASFTALMTALGPLLGGWLVENFSWRWVFYINIPISAIVLFTLYKYVPESRKRIHNTGIDMFGGILITFGLAGVVFGLIESSNHGLDNIFILLSLFAGFVFLILFIIYENNIPNPLIPIHLFRNKEFAAGNLITFLMYSALGGATFYVPFNLIQLQNYTPVQAGAAFIPLLIILFLLSRWSGSLVDKYGAKIPLVLGPLISSLGYLMIAYADLSKNNYWYGLFPAIVVLGFGMTITIAPLTTAVMNSVSASYSGLVSGVNNSLGRISGVMAIAVFGLILFNSFDYRITDKMRTNEFSREVIESIENQKTRLSAITIDGDIDTNTKKKVDKLVRESYLSSFKLIIILTSALAFTSGIVALASIKGNKNKKDDGT